MIRLQGISKTLGTVQVFRDLSFTIEPGSITCILGPSGCGKTTTLQMLAGLDQPDGGSITGQENLRPSYVFQEPRLLPWKTVEDNVHFVLKAHYEPAQRQQLVDDYLERMSLTPYKKHYPNALSGGMKQRLALCRAFAFPHELLLMDEPFKSLDAPLRFNLVKEVAKMWEMNGNTIIFVTHDIAEALLLGHKILVYSAKPTSVRAEFRIDQPHAERDLGSPELAGLFSDLLKMLESEYV